MLYSIGWYKRDITFQKQKINYRKGNVISFVIKHLH